jgi:hypothetical protein
MGHSNPATGAYVREQGNQGFYYKNPEVFVLRFPEICYVSEMDGTGYTYDDFVRAARGNKTLAPLLFETINWQFPEALFTDPLDADEINEQGVFPK